MNLIRLWKLVKKLNLLEKQDRQGLISKSAIDSERDAVWIRLILNELRLHKKIKIIVSYSVLKRRIVYKIRLKKREIEVS